MNIIYAHGDLRGKAFWLGIPYTFQYRFSPLFRRNLSTNGIIADTSGRLQVKSLALDYNSTGYFRLESAAKGRSTSANIFSGRWVGVDDPLIGQTPVEDGTKKFRVFGKNNELTIDLLNDSQLPSNFTGAAWEAEFNELAKRV